MCRETDGMTEDREELRDIHKRIDSLKDEVEQGNKLLTEKMHMLEVAIARGSRFPASAWGAVATILIAILTAGAVNFSELQTTKQIALENKAAINKHTDNSASAQNLTLLLDERIKSLEGRIVGAGPNGWHKSDHENYAKAVDAHMQLLSRRIDALEHHREK